MTQPARKMIIRLGIALALFCCLKQSRSEVITYTLGIHMNCPYGLAR